MILALALVLQEQYDSAIEESQLVARIDPKYKQGGILGQALYLKGQLDLAVQVILRDIERDPGVGHSYQTLGFIYHEQGKKELALAAYCRWLLESHSRIERHHLPLLEDTGTPEQVTAAFREAVVQFQRAIGLDPNSSDACNSIAWELATNINPQFRDGVVAVEFATKACEPTEWKNPMYVDTLAAAYAETRDFDAAVKWQTKAIDLLANEGEKEEYGTRLKLYQENKPYHSPGP
jgi:tetratricopeptide (TPR) repeat protein